jgi:hypothetical protein
MRGRRLHPPRRGTLQILAGEAFADRFLFSSLSPNFTRATSIAAPSLT